MDDGVEEVGDQAERSALRRQARQVHIQALALATVLTGVLTAIP